MGNWGKITLLIRSLADAWKGVISNHNRNSCDLQGHLSTSSQLNDVPLPAKIMEVENWSLQY